MHKKGYCFFQDIFEKLYEQIERIRIGTREGMSRHGLLKNEN